MKIKTYDESDFIQMNNSGTEKDNGSTGVTEINGRDTLARTRNCQYAQGRMLTGLAWVRGQSS